MGLIGGAAQDAVELAQALQALQAACVEAFVMALEMCGNEGQMSIIGSMGVGSFMEAGMEAIEEGDAASTLEALCAHPEAVGEILEESAEGINDAAAEVREAMGAGEEEEDE